MRENGGPCCKTLEVGATVSYGPPSMQTACLSATPSPGTAQDHVAEKHARQPKRGQLPSPWMDGSVLGATEAGN